jgi:membrane-associated protease RseP (regulator of RpoE activity)
VSQLLGILIFVFGILFSIGLHEIGHLLPAKKFGVRVPTYMVGFGPTIWSKRKGETEYGIKAIPMGGYIRMIGMYPPRKSEINKDELSRMGNLIEDARSETLTEITEEDHNRVFYKLSVPKKLTVMFGGPFMNLVIATVLFFVTLSGVGFSAPSTTINQVTQCVPTLANPSGIASTDGSCGEGLVTGAAQAGLKADDKLISIGSVPINNWDDVGIALKDKFDQVVPVVVQRSGSQVTLQATVGTIEDNPGEVRAFLGITPQLYMDRLPVSEVPAEMWNVTVLSVQGLLSFPAEVLTLGSELFSDTPRNIEGPVSVIGIGRISGQVTETDLLGNLDKLSMLLMLLASVNLFLFLFNLVPILPLDGGHIAGALYEGLRKTVAKVLGKPNPGPVDTAKMLPVAYVATLFILAMSLVVMLADVIKPLNLF